MLIERRVDFPEWVGLAHAEAITIELISSHILHEWFEGTKFRVVIKEMHIIK